MRWLVLILLALSLGAQAGKPKPPSDGVTWTHVGTVQGLCGGSYSPPIVTATGVSIFSNIACDGTQGQWNAQAGTWAKVNPSTVVLPYAAIFDEGPATYRVRTSSVQRADGKCYAMLTVGNGYPTTDSYRPAFATSDDCLHFTYQGRMLIDGSDAGYGQTDTAAFVVREGFPPLDHTNQGSNKFLLYENYQTQGASTKGLILVYSADGVSWFRASDAFGAWLDLLPIANVAFPSAALTPYGVHIVAADGYPATKIVHLFSCDGMAFRVIEAVSDLPVVVGKAANLTFDGTLIHSLDGGQHWTLAARDFGC